jgi:ComF family protein
VRFSREGVERALVSAAESLFSIVFPANCRICRSPLTGISALPVCEPCLAGITPLDGTLCSACGEKLFSHAFAGDAGPLCGLCQRVPPRFKRAAAYGAYQGSLRDLIHLFKYQQVKPAAKTLARFLDRAIAELKLPANFTVIPVPLWPGKRHTRGFNQAEDIARAFVRFQAASASIQLETSALIRKRETASQTGLTRPQRRANVRGAFAVVQREKVKGQTILIVDDVMTTGTTAGECARVLLRAGAKEVYVATVARATKELGNGPDVGLNGLSAAAAAVSSGGN